MTKLQDIKRLVAKLASAHKLENARVKHATDGIHKYEVEFEKDKIYHIKFGKKGMEDWHDHHDSERRAAYLKRAKKIRDSNGKLTYNKPTSANFWSVHVLW